MDLLAFKSIAFGLVAVTGLVAGLVPLRMADGDGHQRFFGLSNAFAGGIFLGASLIHMLPDGMDALGEGAEAYPLAAALAAAGFLLILGLERVLLSGQEESEVVVRSATKGAAVGSRSTHETIFPYVLLMVLSVHSLIAGAALGLETTAAASIGILVAILAHKGSAAFALGISMGKGAVERGRATRLIVLFAFTTPIGILIGGLVSQGLSTSAALIAQGVIDGVAAGTFLYVAVLDIIQEEFAEPVDRGAKFAFVILGLAFMAVLAVWD